MVVEAAMVLPIFLLFVLFLISIVQMTLYSTALQSTASDTVKVISTHMYPAALAAQKWGAESGEGNNPEGTEINGTADDSDSSATWSIPRLSLTDWGGEYAAALPKPMDEWVMAALQKGEGPLQELQAEASQSVLDVAVKPLMKPYLSSDLLDYDRIHVSNIIVPDLKAGTNPYFGLEVSYELPMKVPFLNQRIVLEASAVERLWIGDTGETAKDTDEEPEKAENGIVVLEQPNPGVAGQKGKIRAKIPAGASANLSVFYKTGLSTAKYLGWNQADKDGYIEWEWTIGSNTTPGVWKFVIQLEDGRSIEMKFTVVARGSG